MAAFGGHRALFYTPPKGTCSRIISLRLHRISRETIRINGKRVPRCQSTYNLARGITTTARPVDGVSAPEFMLFRDLLSQKPKHNDFNAVSTSKDPGVSDVPTAQSPVSVTAEQFSNSFQRALDALQRRDTRRLLMHLQRISLMDDLELQEAVDMLPRTTFTEFFRSLDPMSVAKYADPTDGTYVSPGMYQTLNMDSFIDDWGVRKLYTGLLQRMMALVVALKASGQILQVEEYRYLLRFAGAASDPAGARWLWNEMVRTDTANLRHSEIYLEYIAARFLTRPMYTGYDKTRMMVQPRNLHRTRIKLDHSYVYKLDRLRLNTRLKRLYFGLNKDVRNAEDIMRQMRKNRPLTRLIYRLIRDGYPMDENLLCAFIVGLGRAGSLRFIGSHMLHKYFGIRMKKLTYEEEAESQAGSKELEIKQEKYIVRPTVRLMQTVAETYGGNAEIVTAIRLVVHISETFSIPIPRSVWQDLLEWTYVMSTPPASTAWKHADMRFKIPDSTTMELIWNAMVAHNVEPGFEQYNIRIRDLIGRSQFSKILPMMRRAIKFYNAHCQEYEDAVFEYVRMIRDGVRLSETVHRYEQARFKKATMYADIQNWCSQYLNNIRSFNHENPLVTVAVPEFIEEFRDFIPNPARYKTAAGYVSIVDPAREIQRRVKNRRLSMSIPIRWKGKTASRRATPFKYRGDHKLTLGGHAPIYKIGLETLLTSTSRMLQQPANSRRRRKSGEGVKVEEATPSGSTGDSSAQSTFDDDEDYF
ncbi:uncharacterized protein F4822DRAFT_423656 [Hypoxylon trugodes]|uniref:uncharacterized protein n=1 Tax=Hypoxylon trugodes TaxID=326681 RepID=UPI0021985B47|nr:uncharacterized protein F4822DRAFT_423656 [Hypoxylon trugodes]KAI1393192.1 hypothetical protein F4822DRAFT_423656 [Hypoxylon trugodes]